MKPYVVAVDAMGGDYGPCETVKGSVLASEEFDVSVMLLGDETIIKDELSKFTYDNKKISIVHCSETIASDDIPTHAIRHKKDSSMVVGLTKVKQGEAVGIVSAGNTGALLAGSTVIIGRIAGIERPALATTLPTKNGFVFLIDSGANVDCKPSYLLQFAKMGSVYVENVFGVKEPKIGLCNVGTEKEKGNQLSKEAYELLSDESLNFVGNVEGREITNDACHVIVCDGFTGNVILKFAEGLSMSLISMIKREIMSGFVSKIGGLLLKDAFSNLKKRLDYSEEGGAPFLGLNSLVVKAHGSSNAKAIKNAVRQCIIFHENDIVEKIKSKI